jgi:general nucleoside transport system permease protein
MESELAGMIFSAPFLSAVIRSAIPIMGAAAGEAVYERAGVINIGLEGMMLSGAFCGVAGSMATGNVWGGVLFAILGGAMIGLLHAFVCVTFKADMILAGIAINFGMLGATEFFSRTIFGPSPKPAAIFDAVHVPWFSDLPFFGEVLFRHIPLVYIIFAMCIAAWFFLFFTLPGLRLRSVGEKPFAAKAAGISTSRNIYAAALICGMFAGISGACFSIGSVRYFSENMTAGNGFIALAVVIVARRNPLYSIFTALVFAVGTALAIRLQGNKTGIVPYHFLMMLPYFLTLLIYFLVNGRKKVSAGG